MRVSAWRIVKRKLAREAFSGEGARLYGGRWNSPGVSVVYVAQSQSLAALELLVHLQNSDVLAEYVVIEARFDDSLVTRIPKANLSEDWRANPPPASARAVGDTWIAEEPSPVLELPSAIIPSENVYLLNPQHRDFAQIEIGEPQAFEFDLRLISKM
ncbi:MAG TPA: RES family NAD+ phosphorylase [Candidatus Acidoferrales bacterium]|nr:RES family NAD+ phosphorylase [Candidatus Acidoferrales bacterium]